MSQFYTPINSEVCPVSGLKVTSKKEWTDLAYTGQFRNSVYLIGPSILYWVPHGYADIKAVQGFIEHHEKVVREAGLKELPCVHIHDLTCLKGTDYAARQKFIDFYMNMKKLKGVVFVNLPFYLRITFSMILKLNLMEFKSLLASDYASGIRIALDLLSSGQTLPEKNVIPENDYEQKITSSSNNSVTKPEWVKMEFDKDYRVSFLVLRNEILYIISFGDPTPEGLKKRLEFQKQILSEYFPENKKYTVVEDFTFLNILLDEAKRIYADYFENNVRINALIVVNPNPMVKLMINIAKKTYHHLYPIETASGYFDAMNTLNRSILNLAPLSGEKKWTSNDIKKGPWINFASNPLLFLFKSHIESEIERGIKFYSEELLEYMNNIDWEKEGSFIEQVDKTHPFYQVFEAINTLKTDLDFLSSEHLKKTGNNSDKPS